MRGIALLLCSCALAGGALLSSVSAASAQASTADIVCALDPKCTRPLTREFRGVTVTKGPDGAAPLSVNLYVNFAFDSAELTSDARITLDRHPVVHAEVQLQLGAGGGGVDVGGAHEGAVEERRERAREQRVAAGVHHRGP